MVKASAKLPKTEERKRNRRQQIPSDFKTDYMRYYNGEIFCADICNKFNISRETVRSWRMKLNLPKSWVRSKIEIPENFTAEYMRYYNGEISRGALLIKFNISVQTFYRWRSEYELPRVIDSPRLVRKHMAVNNLYRPAKSTFTFSLFGYEFYFKVRKKVSEPMPTIDEFPDEIEY